MVAFYGWESVQSPQKQRKKLEDNVDELKFDIQDLLSVLLNFHIHPPPSCMYFMRWQFNGYEKVITNIV